MPEDDLKLGHPKQRINYDLSKQSKEAMKHGQKAPKLDKIYSDRKDPLDIMRQLGFEPTKHMTPIQFLLAVMNDDLDTIFKNPSRRERMERKGGIAMQYRLDAAKSVAKFIHMEMPKMQITSQADKGFGEELASAINNGNDRVVQREIIIKEIERISPDIPLAPASYPPDFIDAEIVEEEDIIEGDVNYNPDEDDQ